MPFSISVTWPWRMLWTRLALYWRVVPNCCNCAPRGWIVTPCGKSRGNSCQFVESPPFPFILNDDPQLAAELDADGVHIGQDDGSLLNARAIVGEGKTDWPIDPLARPSKSGYEGRLSTTLVLARSIPRRPNEVVRASEPMTLCRWNVKSAVKFRRFASVALIAAILRMC